MRQITVHTFVTLDGVMQAPGGPEEDTDGGFTHGGWSFHYWDAVMAQAEEKAFAEPFELLLGRRTYDIFAAHWPYQPANDPIAVALNGATKHVVSSRLKNPQWENTHVIAGNVLDELLRLKNSPGPELRVIGSSRLVQMLLIYSLIDEFRVWIFPLLLGQGKRLFGDGTVPAALELVDTQTSTTGVMMNTYRLDGPVRLGSFAQEQPSERELARRRNMTSEAGE